MKQPLYKAAELLNFQFWMFTIVNRNGQLVSRFLIISYSTSVLQKSNAVPLSTTTLGRVGEWRLHALLISALDATGEWSVSYSGPFNLKESPQHPVDMLG